MEFDGRSDREKVYVSQSHQKKVTTKKQFLEKHKAEKAQKSEARLQLAAATKLKIFFKKCHAFFKIRDEFVKEYDQTLVKLVTLKATLPKPAFSLVIAKCFPYLRRIFTLFIDIACIHRNPTRLTNFIEILDAALEEVTLQPVELHLLLSKVSLLVPCTLCLLDGNEAEPQKCLKFICLALTGKNPSISKKLTSAQMTKSLQNLTFTHHALKFLSLPATLKASTPESPFAIFVNVLLLAACAICLRPKACADKTYFKSRVMYMTYMNYGLGNPVLFAALRTIPYIDTGEIAITLSQNIEKDLGVHTQAWKHNKRLFHATHNFVKLAHSLTPSQAAYSWGVVSGLLAALADFHQENPSVALSNPINKCYKEYKIVHMVQSMNWKALLDDLEKLASEKYVKHYIESIQHTPLAERPKMTENFAALCISMINFAKNYEDRMTTTKHLPEEEEKMVLGEEMEELKEASTGAVYQSTFEQNLLTHLSFGSEILLKHLWEIIEPCKTRELLVNSYGCTFHLFCKLYLQVLFVMDDMEFTGKTLASKKEGFAILNHEQLKWLCHTINELVYKLYIEHGNNVKYFSLRHDTLRLLKHLYDRTRRNKMFPPEFWYLSHAKFKGPLLEAILEHIPHVIPFEQRVSILRTRLQEEKAKFGGHTAVVIRRDMIFEDSLMALHKLGPYFKQDIGVQFTNKAGIIEIGAGHGVFKEFLTVLSKQAFDIRYGFFTEIKNRELFPNPDYIDAGNYQRVFEFLGMIVGKAIFEGILIQPIFSRCFLNKVLGKTNHIDDLKLLDEKLYENVMYLKYYEGDVESLGLTFTVSTIKLGKHVEVPLIPNGNEIPVTKENLYKYIILLANYKLNKIIEKPSEYFSAGISHLVDIELLSMFNQDELQMLIGGESGEFSLTDLKQNVQYNGFSPEDPFIKAFWEVVAEFTPEQQSRFLMFVTGCSRPPLLGFAYLNPKFCITRGTGSAEELPTSSTCVNLLKVPVYSSKTQIREKMLIALKECEGFGLA